jgi:hypothetical protein
MNTEKISFIMFKIIGGTKVHLIELNAISDLHAVQVATGFHERNGLIGRYYIETSTGGIFTIS